MIPQNLLDEIKCDAFLQYMHSHVLKFNKYLDVTDKTEIRIKGIRHDPYASSCEPVAVDADIGWLHRWMPKYDHFTLWKLYNLKYYYQAYPEKMPKYSMMITSTGIHATPRIPSKKGMSHMQYLDKFHNAHRLQKGMIQRYLGKQDYLSILEGHPTSGYVHSHDLYFLYEKPLQKTLDVIENHWNKTQGMGNAEHGIEIKVKEPKNFAEIQSLIAYPMAYLGKTTIGDLPEWNKYDVIFNTCLWLSAFPKQQGGIGTRVRAFQPSRSLSSIMSREYLPKGSVPVPSTSYIHIETTMKTPDSYDPSITYKSPHYDMNMKAWHNLTGE